MLKRLFSDVSIFAKSISSAKDEAWGVDWKEVLPWVETTLYAFHVDCYVKAPVAAVHEAMKDVIGNGSLDKLERILFEGEKVWCQGIEKFAHIFSFKKLGYARRFRFDEIAIRESDDEYVFAYSSMKLTLLKNTQNKYIKLDSNRYKKFKSESVDGVMTVQQISKYYRVVNKSSVGETCCIHMVEDGVKEGLADVVKITFLTAKAMRDLMLHDAYEFSFLPAAQ